MQENLVKQLLLKEVGTTVNTVRVLTGGQVGHVYRADSDNKSYVVKFIDAHTELLFSEESRDDRVYGSRWSNLLPAYSLLRSSGIAVPKLYVSGTLDAENLHYEIMDYLEGSPEDYSPEWFALLGEVLGRINSIKRSYQGWVGMSEPYVETWTDAFTKSLALRLEETKPFLEELLYTVAHKYISTSQVLDEPSEFVLSHTDGFQGVMKKESAGWRLVGVVDIEDYQFTDQRFVLAGLELSHSFEGRTLPKEFWESYTSILPVDPTFNTHKKLFQVYYLLVWIRVLRKQPEPYKRCISKLSDLLL